MRPIKHKKLNTYFNWQDSAPPKNTWVWAKYNPNEKWQMVKTCQRGCCVHSLFGNMVLPTYWYLATIEEGIQEQAKWNKQPQIDFFDLYGENDES